MLKESLKKEESTRKSGRFARGFRCSPATEFKKGQHWRPRSRVWEKEYLNEQYIKQQKSAKDIAAENGVTEGAIFYWLSKHGIKRRSISEARRVKKWGSCGEKNPMFGRCGQDNPHWIDGSSPLR